MKLINETGLPHLKLKF